MKTLAILFTLAATPAAALCEDGTLQGIKVQEQFGTVSCKTAPDGRMAFHAAAGPKRGGRVGKADAILPLGPARAGDTVTASAEVLIPEGAPANSVHLMDFECKRCGLPGNPGLRLYLRDGRLRIDRAKIGVRHAWTAEMDPLPVGRWVRIDWTLVVGPEGSVRVAVDGRNVLEEAGATTHAEGRAGVDRLQIGVTANSNPVPAEVWMRDIRVIHHRGG